MNFNKDPFGSAIHDYVEHGVSEHIVVMADLCEDDVMPVEYLFRTQELMPELEVKALQLCQGNVLDVGACAGCHSYWLKENKIDVTAIDTSPGAIEHLNNLGIRAERHNFFDYAGQFDTILTLMNGIGITGTLERLPIFLRQIKKLMKPNGRALCDSTDIKYLYEEDDGSYWVDLNSKYWGEMQFKMKHKTAESDWFNWLYVDFETLKTHAEKANLNCNLVFESPTNNYLAELTHL